MKIIFAIETYQILAVLNHKFDLSWLKTNEIFK